MSFPLFGNTLKLQVSYAGTYCCFFTYSRYVTSDYDDFSNETLQMRFNSNEACVDIKLIDDNMVELDEGYYRESFRVTLESPDNNVGLEVISARVYIIDDDCKC